MLRAMDFDLFKLVNGFAIDHDGFEDVLRFLALDAQFFFMALLAGLFLATGKWRTVTGRHGVAAAGFSAALALGVAQLLAMLWERPRPYVAHPDESHLFIAPSHDPSFPSDHATAAFAIAVAIWLRNRVAGSIALALAFAVSVGRVAVGTHYPGDVLAGAAVGTACALLLWLPPVRARLHALADWAGATYDRLIQQTPFVPST
jgi:undecaprenyl-diphosphatase